MDIIRVTSNDEVFEETFTFEEKCLEIGATIHSSYISFKVIGLYRFQKIRRWLIKHGIKVPTHKGVVI